MDPVSPIPAFVALGAAFLLKFAKVIGLGAIVVAALRRLLGRAKPKAPE